MVFILFAGISWKILETYYYEYESRNRTYYLEQVICFDAESMRIQREINAARR
jgi:hypothetical protein